MKNRYNLNAILLLVFLGWAKPLLAQTSSSDSSAIKKDTTVTLDLFKSPASPGAALLGISPNDVQKPSDPKAFGVQLQNASNSFTNIPLNFAVDIAPFWFFGGKNISFTKYNNNKNVVNNIAQSLVISAAYKQDTTFKINKSQFGLGFKFSLIRGKLNEKDTELINKSIIKLNKLFTNDSLIEVRNTKYEAFNKLSAKRDSLIKLKGTLLKANKHLTEENIKSTIDNFKLVITGSNSILPKDRLELVRKAIEEKRKAINKELVLVEKAKDTFKPSLENDTTYKNILATNAFWAQQKKLELSKTYLDYNKIKEINEKIAFTNTLKEDYEKSHLDDSLEVAALNLSKEKQTQKLTYVREGWVLDVAGGLAWDYPNNQLSTSKLTKSGLWVVGGYEVKKFSALGMVRYLNNPDKLFIIGKDTPQYQDASNIDVGVRLIYENPDKKISISGEAIRRWINQDDPKLAIAPSYRLTLNAEYKINDSMALTFVFGRDFDNTITKSGTLVSFLNLLTTFGKTAPVLK